MYSEPHYKDLIPTNRNAPRAPWLWIWGSGIGAFVGAVFALALFPSAGFGIHPIGQFSWHLVGFAFSIGISFAVSQWIILRHAARYRKIANIPLLVMWIPVSSIGVTFMILPLWRWDAGVFMYAPWYVVVPMLPGMIFLGLGQWLILYRGITARIIWVLFTIMGAMAGAVAGLVVAFYLPLPLEATWAFVTAAGIGALQGFVLASDLDTDLRRQETSSGVLLLLGIASFTVLFIYIILDLVPYRVVPQAGVETNISGRETTLELHGLDAVEISISGQGTWETTLKARDLDSDASTIEGYYDTILDITWLADANYAKTNGDSANGRMNWPEANAWAARIDINGVTGWRLPTLSPINGVTFDGIYTNNATTDYGMALSTTNGTDGGWRDSEGNPVSEMGHMYYVTLGNIGRCLPDYDDRCIEQPGYGLSNTGPFSNIQKLRHYWTGLETGTMIDFAWYFSFNSGQQGSSDGVAFAWTIHDGDIGTPVINASVSTE